ncbi:MAG TPA: nuclear transport factor 2 family protein [Cytophagales bacterium]|nr:nuclear transport factor 2 family protein [Cytophagales bacterium]
MEPKEVITQFYTAFAEGDTDTMASCYTDDVQFEDPAFGKLQGPEVMAMWRMLLERSKGNLKITFDQVGASGNTGNAIWVARYPFGPKKRPVHNVISASFSFRDGKIAQHTDVFSFWRWSRQALGLPGLLLGWTPFLRGKVNKQTRSLLKRYMGKIDRS